MLEGPFAIKKIRNYNEKLQDTCLFTFHSKHLENVNTINKAKITDELRVATALSMRVSRSFQHTFYEEEAILSDRPEHSRSSLFNPGYRDCHSILQDMRKLRDLQFRKQLSMLVHDVHEDGPRRRSTTVDSNRSSGVTHKRLLFYMTARKAATIEIGPP